MLTLHELWLLFQAIWNTGNRWARLAVSLSLVWPILLVLVALFEEPVITALFALIAVVMLIFLAVFLLDPVLIGILAMQDSIRKFLRFLASLVAVEVAISIYFSVTPVWGNGGSLIPLLFLAAIAVVFLKLGLPGKLSGLAGLMAMIMVIITLSFFLPKSFEKARDLPGKIDSTIVNLVEGKSVSAAARPSTPTPPAIEEFRLNAGDTVKTVFAQSGMNYLIEGNHPWILLCDNHGEHRMAAGRECIQGADPPGLVRVRGLQDGTVLKFQRVNG